MGELAFEGAGRIDPSKFVDCTILGDFTIPSIKNSTIWESTLSDDIGNYDAIIVRCFNIKGTGTIQFGIGDEARLHLLSTFYKSESAGFFVNTKNYLIGFFADNNGGTAGRSELYCVHFAGKGTGFSVSYNNPPNTVPAGSRVQVYGLKF